MLSRLLARTELRHPGGWRRLWWLALAATVVVSLLPAPAWDLAIEQGDKWLHGVGYGLLSLYAGILFAPGSRGRAAVLLLVLSLAIEGLQALLPWRRAEFADAVVNLLAVVAGQALARTPLVHTLSSFERLLGGRSRADR